MSRRHNSSLSIKGRHRVVVTGLGVICSLGDNKEVFWKNLLSGKDGYGRITLFDTSPFNRKIACEVKDFHPEIYLDKPVAGNTNRCIQFAMIASKECIKDAGLQINDYHEHAAVVVGTNEGGMLSFENTLKHTSDKKSIRDLFHLQLFRIADIIFSYFSLQGPAITISTSCSSSLNAIGIGKDLITSGKVDVAIAGGSNTICQLNFSTFCAIRAMEKQECRPFDAERKGVILGEGAAFLVLEELEHALKRKARIYAELVSYAIACDAYHLSIPHPEGRGAVSAMKKALEIAGLNIDEIDYINAHGTGTPPNDEMETKAIKRVFGRRSYDIPISSIKSMIGHCMGSAGAIGCLSTTLSVFHNVCPPTINYKNKDPVCNLDYIPNKSRSHTVRVALCNSFGGGGINTVCALKKWDQ